MLESDFLAFLVACILAFGVRAVAGSWAHPSSLFALVWALLLGIPGLLITDFDSTGLASWVIVGCVLSASVGAVITVHPTETRLLQFKAAGWVRYFVIFGGLSALMSAILVQRSNGIVLLSFDDLIESARQVTVLRYEGELYSPPVATVLLAVAYGAALVAPFASAKARGVGGLLLLVLPAAGTGLYAVLTTARAPFLIAAALSLSAWIAQKHLVSGGRSKLILRSGVPMLLGALAVFSVFVIVAANRRGGFSEVGSDDLMRSISVYVAGSLPALGKWLPDAPLFPTSLGVETFAGVWQFVLMDLSLGSARDDVTAIGSGLSTNVYTVFRTLAEDFSVAGMFVFIAVASGVAASAYRRAITGGSMAAVAVMSSWGAFVLFSQTTSIFSFANVCLGVSLGGIALVYGVKTEQQVSNIEGVHAGSASLES